MPKKLTNKEIKELKYVSMADCCAKVKQYPDMNDKLRFVTQYLLLHGTQGEPDYTLAEATYIAQLAIVAASKVEKEKMGKTNADFLEKNPQIVNPHVKNAKDDLAFELFLRDPHQYLKGYAQKNADAIENSNIIITEEKVAKEHFENFIKNKLEPSDFNSDVYDHLDERSPVAIKLRMEMMLGGKDRLDATVKAAQPGFWSKFFDTSSLAAKNLLTVFDAYTNKNHTLYGDREALKKASTEYLEYKFPNWKPGSVLPDPNDPSLDATEKARVTLCVTSLQTMELQEMFDDDFKKQVDEAYKVQGITFKDIDRPPLSQDLFQDNLINDLNKDEDRMSKSLDDSDNEIDNDLENENEIIIHNK